jgi:hypothetical protein
MLVQCPCRRSTIPIFPARGHETIDDGVAGSECLFTAAIATPVSMVNLEMPAESSLQEADQQFSHVNLILQSVLLYSVL